MAILNVIATRRRKYYLHHSWLVRTHGVNNLLTISFTQGANIDLCRLTPGVVN